MAKINVRNAHTAPIYLARAAQPDPKDPKERRAVREPVAVAPGAVGEVDSDNPSIAIYMGAGLLVPLAGA